MLREVLDDVFALPKPDDTVIVGIGKGVYNASLVIIWAAVIYMLSRY